MLLILGVLAAIAIPTFNRIQENSVERAVLSSAESIVRNANSIAASERNLGGDVDAATLWEAAAEAYGFDAATEADQDWTSANGDQAAVIETNGANSAATGSPVSLTLTEESGNICKSLSIEIDPSSSNDGSRVYVETGNDGEKVVSDCGGGGGGGGCHGGGGAPLVTVSLGARNFVNVAGTNATWSAQYPILYTSATEYWFWTEARFSDFNNNPGAYGITSNADGSKNMTAWGAATITKYDADPTTAPGAHIVPLP